MFMRTMAIAALAAGVAASSASADPTYSFRNNDGAAGWSGMHDHEGTHEPVWSAFDPVTNRLLFEAAFLGNAWSAPAAHHHEMARFFSDATGGTGRRPVGATGSASTGGAGWAAGAAGLEPSGESLVSVDAAAILGFRPGGGAAEGAGDRSADSFGFWLHSLRRFDIPNRDRRTPGGGGVYGLGDFEASRVDGAEVPMKVVPLPTSAAMAALGLVGIAASRRRA